MKYLLALCILAGALPTFAQALDPTARAAVPVDGKMTFTDYGYRDWGPDLVEYTIDPVKWAGKLTVLDPAGKPVPCQVDGNVLSFVAFVPRGQSVTYTLQRGGVAAPSPLQTEANKGHFFLRNEFLSLQMPGTAVVGRFNPPQPVANVRGPLDLCVNLVDGGGMSGSRFITDRTVTEIATKVLRQGPAVVDYEIRYTFEPKGEYVFRVRMVAGVPLASVTEEFDFGSITEGKDVLMLDLHRGWTPKSVGFIRGNGEQLLPRFDVQAYDRVAATKPMDPPTGKPGEAPAYFIPEAGLASLGNLRTGVQVWDGDQPGTGKNIAFIPLHMGSWRRGMATPGWFKQGTGVQISLPISARYSRWTLEVTDDHSPFSTHEHDPGLKESYGRREWALYAGQKPDAALIQYGHIGLNRYKDWVIDYPEGPAAKNAYPGAFFRADYMARMKKVIDQHPEKAWLSKYYLISGNPADAEASAREVISRLRAPYQENDFYLAYMANYRKAQLLIFANRAEDALACPTLPADLRQELRRRLALYAYVTSDPDFNPRGGGFHEGNNNMPVNRTMSLAYFAGLLPDHPCYKYWMDQVYAYTRYKLSNMNGPDGANLECPTYSTYAPLPSLNVALNILKNRGYDTRELLPYLKANLIYMANLSMADPRWGGARILPGMGNSGNQLESMWGVAVTTFEDSEPKFAGWLSYIFRLEGRKFGPESTGVTMVGHPMYYLPDVPETQTPLTTTIMPTYGVAFRHQFNTPNETAMLLRAGIAWGHWDTDALNAILYGKGAPLSPGTMYQYYFGVATQNNAVYHNQVKIGTRSTHECFGRVDDHIRDYGFGPSADYAVAGRYYPSQLFDEYQDGKLARKGAEVTWNRHAFFVKTAQPTGPSYFVMRDTFTGDTSRPTWWEWMNLDTADLISVDGVAFDPTTVPREKVVPEEQFPTLRGQTVEMRTKYGAATWMWFTEPREVKARLTWASQNNTETKTILVVPGKPGQDYCYVLYPLGAIDAKPTAQALGAGIVRVTTPESVDTVFLGDTPFAYDKDGIVFTGKAGAVRVYPDRVTLCLNAGTGKIGYKGFVLEGSGPFERTVKLKELKRGTQKYTAGYEKKEQRVDLGNGMTVVGEGPFTATLDGKAVRISVDGRARVLHIWETGFQFVRPRMRIDGKEWMACWTDYPDNGWGSFDQTYKVGLSVPDGKHEVIVDEQTYPANWARPFAPTIDGVLVK
jgi:hypothetical protein